MFGKALVPELRPEQLTLARFDLYLYDVMKSERLEGQIVFEYGTLLRSIGSWAGLRVLDVGTGRSTLPAWMCHAGARATAQVAFALRAAQQQFGHHSQLHLVNAQPFVHVMPISGHAAAARAGPPAARSLRSESAGVATGT